MSEDAANHLRFSVEESIRLQKGQEIQDAISMSLEPDISIHQNRHYVSISGALLLTGEFRPKEYEEEHIKPSGNENHALEKNVLHQVDLQRRSESGMIQIQHRFPVDITIPLNRIDRLDDLYVMVDTFDYILPGDGQILVKADLLIRGLTADIHAESEGLTKAPLEGARDQQNVEESGETEMTMGPVDEEQEIDAGLEEHEEDEADPRVFHLEAVRKESIGESLHVGDDGTEKEHAWPVVEMKSRKPQESEKPHVLENESVPEERNRDDTIEEDNKDHTEDVRQENAAKQAEQSSREENALYLTRILTKAEEDFSKMKMVIVQHGESLDLVAERYHLSSSQLMRVNHLRGNEIEEGQVLLIPV